MIAIGLGSPTASTLPDPQSLGPRLSAEARRVLLASTRRSVAQAAPAADDRLLRRLRALGGADELVEAYHFRRGTLTRWAAELAALPSPAAAVDAAVRARLEEIDATPT